MLLFLRRRGITFRTEDFRNSIHRSGLQPAILFSGNLSLLPQSETIEYDSRYKYRKCQRQSRDPIPWSFRIECTDYCWRLTRLSSASDMGRRWLRSSAPAAAPHTILLARRGFCASGCPRCGIGPVLRWASDLPAYPGGRGCTLFMPGVPATS